MRPNITRRKLLATTGAATATLAVAGCLGDDGDDDDTGDDADTGDDTGDDSDDGDVASYEVGHGDYQTTVSADEFPDDNLYAYAVQTGWSNWDAVMDAFEDEYGITLNDDQRTSGEALSHARSNAQNPTHSVFNGGYSFVIEAMEDGLTTDYQPAGWDAVPDEFKTDNNHAVTTRQMTVSINYRRDIYEERGLDEPETWEDLKHPDIAQDLAFNTPHAASGLASLLSVNHAYGGDMNNLDPVIEYLEDLEGTGADHRRNLSQEFTAGEVSTYAEYDFGGLQTKYLDDDLDEDQVGVVIPTGPDGEPGAMNVPYGFALMEGAPNEGPGKLFMDFVLSPDIQELFFDGFVRPIRADELDAPDEFPPQDEYDAAEFAYDQEEYVERQEDMIDELIDRTPLDGAAG